MSGKFQSILKRHITKNSIKNISLNSRLDNWLLKKGVISNISSPQEKGDMILSGNQNSKENQQCRKSISNVSKPKKKNRKNSCNANNNHKQVNLDFFISKIQTDLETSSENCDLPKIRISNSTVKNNKHKKYGVSIPTIDEILQEQKELEEYKNKLDSFQSINESRLELHATRNISGKGFEFCDEILDCKHLSLKEISKAVRTNLSYLKDIMNRKVFNRRHELFHNKSNKCSNLSTKHLTYNTSMVLFTYEQMEFILCKLKKHLDPDDKLTQYFFKVLLPELCLQIFIDTYNMSYEDAVTYLDTRPLEI